MLVPEIVPHARYMGPLRAILRGDRVEALKRLGIARALLGKLKSILAMQGIGSGSLHRTEPDGTLIHVQLVQAVGAGIPPLHIVQITSVSLEEEELEALLGHFTVLLESTTFLPVNGVLTLGDPAWEFEQRLANAKNIDWRNEDDERLSFQGPPGRQLNSIDSDGIWSLQIYQNEVLFAVAPAPVTGVAQNSGWTIAVSRETPGYKVYATRTPEDTTEGDMSSWVEVLEITESYGDRLMPWFFSPNGLAARHIQWGNAGDASRTRALTVTADEDSISAMVADGPSFSQTSGGDSDTESFVSCGVGSTLFMPFVSDTREDIPNTEALRTQVCAGDIYTYHNSGTYEYTFPFQTTLTGSGPGSWLLNQTYHRRSFQAQDLVSDCGAEDDNFVGTVTGEQEGSLVAIYPWGEETVWSLSTTSTINGTQPESFMYDESRTFNTVVTWRLVNWYCSTPSLGYPRSIMVITEESSFSGPVPGTGTYKRTIHEELVNNIGTAQAEEVINSPLAVGLSGFAWHDVCDHPEDCGVNDTSTGMDLPHNRPDIVSVAYVEQNRILRGLTNGLFPSVGTFIGPRESWFQTGSNAWNYSRIDARNPLAVDYDEDGAAVDFESDYISRVGTETYALQTNRIYEKSPGQTVRLRTSTTRTLGNVVRADLGILDSNDDDIERLSYYSQVGSEQIVIVEHDYDAATNTTLSDTTTGFSNVTGEEGLGMLFLDPRLNAAVYTKQAPGPIETLHTHANDDDTDPINISNASYLLFDPAVIATYASVKNVIPAMRPGMGLSVSELYSGAADRRINAMDYICCSYTFRIDGNPDEEVAGITDGSSFFDTAALTGVDDAKLYPVGVI